MKKVPNLTQVKETSLSINSAFLLDESNESEDMDSLQEHVKEVVHQLLDTNFEHLLQVLYRIDVSEEKVKRILNISDPERISSELADLIIRRELAKVQTRLKYNQES